MSWQQKHRGIFTTAAMCKTAHGGQRAAVYTAAFIQKVTLSQDDMRSEMQFASRSNKHHLTVAIRDSVFSPAFQDGPQGGEALTLGAQGGISGRKQEAPVSLSSI